MLRLARFPAGTAPAIVGHMLSRPLVTVLAAAGAIITPTTVVTHSAASFATPTTTTTTTTTTTQLSIVVPPRTTTPNLAIPTTTTTTTTTTTAPPVIVAQPAPPTAPALATPTVPPEPGTDLPIGALEPGGGPPDGLDLSAFPDAPPAPTGGGGGGDGPTFSAGMTCFNQCIKSGVAYPRGFGTLLVVETHVPARLWIGVADDDNDYVGHTTSDGLVTESSFAFDHLEPGHTYNVTVAATDENDDTSHAYGMFTTLSERTVTVGVGSPVYAGGPSNIIDDQVYLRVADLSWRLVHPPEDLVYYSVPRHLDLGVVADRTWAHSQSTFCEGWSPSPAYPEVGGHPYGDNDASCNTWNTASLVDLDTDAIPAGRSHWTEVEISRALSTGDGVPPDGAGPRYFDFSLWITVTVEYR
jgi:hypothetical protein